MDNKASLSDLCSICHTESPKYRCPRCKTQTCSLPCYKKHQQRAACNGKRDPTTFVKKSQWATPAGVDHDYNYLKSVERTIGDAGEGVQLRGIGVTAPTLRGAAKAWQPDSGLMKYLNHHRITVDRAPLGMSRQKNNRTRVSKKGRVAWTVEWIDLDSTSHLQNECSSSLPVKELYALLQASLRNAAKRRSGQTEDPAAESGHSSKRRRIEVPPGGTSDSTKLDLAAHDADQDVHHMAEVNFYLFKPGASTKRRIVIPMNSDISLTDSLQDQTVQEYPTIYVLREQPNALPTPFMVEKDYVTTLSLTTSSTARTPTNDAGPRNRKPGAEVQPTTTVDAQSILDMLKRDVTV